MRVKTRLIGCLIGWLTLSYMVGESPPDCVNFLVQKGRLTLSSFDPANWKFLNQVNAVTAPHVLFKAKIRRRDDAGRVGGGRFAVEHVERSGGFRGGERIGAERRARTIFWCHFARRGPLLRARCEVCKICF